MVLCGVVVHALMFVHKQQRFQQPGLDSIDHAPPKKNERLKEAQLEFYVP